MDEMFAEALRRDPNRARTGGVLVDGNKTQIRDIRAAAKRAGVVAAALRRQATCKKLAKRESIDKAAATLLVYKSMLRYDEHLPAGLPIATGVIEGACPHLVKDRMDITGDMEAYWQLHKRQEFWRNHASRYADAEETWLWPEAA